LDFLESEEAGHQICPRGGLRATRQGPLQLALLGYNSLVDHRELLLLLRVMRFVIACFLQVLFITKGRVTTTALWGVVAHARVRENWPLSSYRQILSSLIALARHVFSQIVVKYLEDLISILLELLLLSSYLSLARKAR
jgi:hypothetical protein